jgi:hypothetical protein
MVEAGRDAGWVVDGTPVGGVEAQDLMLMACRIVVKIEMGTYEGQE